MKSNVIQSPSVHLSAPQRDTQKILEVMTGLNVRAMAVVLSGGVSTVGYLFKCKHSKECFQGDEDAQVRAKVMEIHAFNGYIKKLLVIDTGATFDHLIVEMVADADDPDNDIWPCVRARFCNILGVPHADEEALAIAERLHHKLEHYVRQNSKEGQLGQYQQQLRKTASFMDGYE